MHWHCLGGEPEPVEPEPVEPEPVEPEPVEPEPVEPEPVEPEPEPVKNCIITYPTNITWDLARTSLSGGSQTWTLPEI